ncbi:LOW QUALITY PROTEIN: UPF0481 protein At3g47200 [Quercus suber]
MIDIVDAASDQMEASKGVSLKEEEPANLVTSLREKLDSLSRLSSQSCIYRIPKRLRKWNNEAYTPHIVSIGPLHHGSTDLQAMEEHKLRYLEDFLLYTKVSLEDYVKLLREREARIRNSYEETIKLGSDEFLEMILVDAAFVIEVLFKFHYNLNNDSDRIFSKPWLISDIWYDILLLENQLPFFILEDFFVKARITVPPEQDERLSLIRLTHNVLKKVAFLGEIEQLWTKLCSSKIEHFLHFVRICHIPQEPPHKLLREREARIRNSYEETIKLGSDEFLEMILVDAAFVIEVLFKFHYNLNNDSDRIFSKPWLISDIWYDILLLENQLPFFILEDFFVKARITVPPEQDERLSLIRLTHNVLKKVAFLGEIEQLWTKLCSSKIEHFLHFVRICHIPQEPPPKGKLITLSAPNATQLHQAGVRFKVGSPKNLFNIKFKNGILEISNIRIHDKTEAFFRNLIAFEQCHMRVDYISDYFIALDRLIDTPNDVELLVQCGIIENWLPNSQMVVTLINNLVFGTVTSTANFYFANLLGELNAYCSVPWHKWKATLNEDYFSTPWAVISVSAATVFLILTLIQTVCSVISL